ncbi:AMP-binding protein [Kangiella sp. HD9-110m-PIT-SAG07]|nr:AMP-binding protein [Kangiella sp. HD9-110m-PIT-SAG07]
MKYPEIIDQHCQDHRFTLTLRVSPELEAFDGHFDTFPIIPGVVQIQWAMHFAKQLEVSNSISSHSAIQKISSLKFQQIITPNRDVNLTLSFDETKQCLIFAISDEEHRYSSGKLFLSAG